MRAVFYALFPRLESYILLENDWQECFFSKSIYLETHLVSKVFTQKSQKRIDTFENKTVGKN
jgi:hypothetical protein